MSEEKIEEQFVAKLTGQTIQGDEDTNSVKPFTITIYNEDVTDTYIVTLEDSIAEISKFESGGIPKIVNGPIVASIIELYNNVSEYYQNIVTTKDPFIVDIKYVQALDILIELYEIIEEKYELM